MQTSRDRRRGGCLSIATLLLAGSLCQGQVAWKTGREFERELLNTVSFDWRSNPIRSALGNLSRNQAVSIFIDRRVPTDLEVDFSARRSPLGEALRRAVVEYGFETCYVGDVVYIGPPAVVQKLESVAAVQLTAAERLSPPARRKWQQPAATRSEFLAKPRAIIAAAAAQADVEVSNLEQLPHDLWAAGELPKLNLSDRLTVLLAGFDLTFRTDSSGARIELIPLPADARVPRTYLVTERASSLAKTIEQRFPAAELRRTGNRLQVLAGFQDHFQIARLLEAARQPAAPTSGGTQVYTLTIKNQPVGGVLKALAEKWKLKTDVSPQAAERLDQRVSFSVRDASMRQVLEQALLPADLTFDLQGNMLRVTTK